MLDFVETHHAGDSVFRGSRKVGRAWSEVVKSEGEKRSGETVDALWTAMRDHAGDEGAGTYRVTLDVGDDDRPTYYTFRIDPDADGIDDPNVTAEALSYRQLAMDYRQFGLDQTAHIETLVRILPKVMVESGRTASSFSRSFADINQQAREQASVNADVEADKADRKAAADQMKEVTTLFKQLLTAGALKSKDGGNPIAWLTAEQATSVRELETLSRLFLGDKPSGELLATLLSEHKLGLYNPLLVSLSVEQRDKLAAHFGVPAEMFAPSEDAATAAP